MTDKTTPRRDYVGRAIEVFDTIAYPSRRGSSMVMNLASVTEMGWEGGQEYIKVTPIRRGRRMPASGKWVRLTRLDNVVLVQSAREYILDDLMERLRQCLTSRETDDMRKHLWGLSPLAALLYTLTKIKEKVCG